MKYLLVVFYTGITSFLYFGYSYSENDSPIQLFIATLILYLPVLSAVSSYRLNLTYLHYLTIFGFCVGFVMGSNSNLGPIALMFWLISSMPGILFLNFVCYLYKKNRDLEDITDPYTPADMLEACKILNETRQVDDKNV